MIRWSLVGALRSPTRAEEGIVTALACGSRFRRFESRWGHSRKRASSGRRSDRALETLPLLRALRLYGVPNEPVTVTALSVTVVPSAPRAE